MARKNKLDSVVENANAIIGIATTHRDFRLVHFINQSLGLKLASVDDLPIYQPKTDSLVYFAFYLFHHPDLRTDFYLISNHNATNQVLPSLKQINYLLLIQGAAYPEHIESMVSTLRKIQGIQAALPVNQKAIKEIGPLLEDLELHKLELMKSEEEKKGKLFRSEAE